MERVKTGTIYWYITIYGEVECDYECDSVGDFMCFSTGNYFHTKEEAEATVRKLRAVMKGADVIEMPSEEEIEAKSNELRMGAINFLIETFGSEQMSVLNTSGAWEESMEDLVSWLKSKIVK